MTEQAATLHPELIAQIRGIQLRSRRLASLNLAGEWKSAFKGRGMEFEEVREYTPGDDVRALDWNVTARTGIPHIKVYREERELTVMLLVDLSGSGDFGTGTRRKREVIAEVAAILAYTAIRSNDRVGLLSFTDRVEKDLQPKKGRAHVWRVIREVLTARVQSRGTNIAHALRHLLKTQPRSTITFLISDFLDRNWADALRQASRKHDITAVSVTDEREMNWPNAGLLELEDAETGARCLVNTRSDEAKNALLRAAQQRQHERDASLRSAGVKHIQVRTDEPILDPILRHFRYR